jgi:DNA-binding SARP family transcriptional activator
MMTRQNIRIEVFAGRVRRDGTTVAINPRERALLYALTVVRRPIPREDLQAQLWPDLEPAAARNALGVCLHRLRRQIGDPTAVLRAPNGYVLGPHVGVDLWEAEELEHRIVRSAKLDPADRAAGRNLLASLAAAPSPLPNGDAFASFRLRVDLVRRNIGVRLAADALAGGEIDKALGCAMEVLENDACDEAACEIAMRAYIAAGDRASAIREYRTFEHAMSTELDLRPSSYLWSLLDRAGESRTYLQAVT